MKQISQNKDDVTKWLRRIARTLGLLASVFWLFAVTASGINDIVAGGVNSLSREGAKLWFLLVLAALSLIIAWRRERLGGVLVIAGGTALGRYCYLTAGHNKIWIMLMTGGPFLVAGILFLAVWLRAQRRKA